MIHIQQLDVSPLYWNFLVLLLILLPFIAVTGERETETNHPIYSIEPTPIPIASRKRGFSC